MKSTKPGKNPSAATPVAEAERLYCVLMKCNPTDAAPVVQSPLVEALGRNHATLIREYPRRSESVRALSKGGRLLPPLLARLIPNRAILVASGLPRSARNAGTCSVDAMLGLYSKLMSERVRLRGISLHSLRPRIRLHMAGMTDSVSARSTGAAGVKDIYGRCGSLGIVCAACPRDWYRR